MKRPLHDRFDASGHFPRYVRGWPALLLAAVLAGCGGAAPSAAVEISDVELRLPPSAGRPGVGYLTLHNVGDTALALTAVESAAFGRIEIHQTQRQNGMMRMRRLDSLPVPAGESVRLQRGGAHLMLFRASDGVAAGDEVLLRLHFRPAPGPQAAAEAPPYEVELRAPLSGY